MASTSVVFDLIAKDRASDAFQRVSRSAGHTSGTMSRLGAVAGRVAKAGLFAAGVGAVAAGKGLYEMAQSAAEDEAAQVRLATSLRNATGATKDQIASTESWITAQGKALGVTDDDLRPALARLAEATGDVGQAQKLASLAMDVSAGTGRSLKSVSEALMKAQNGQISGLSRLGIETKNAAGETLTFEQATRRMAETFKGHAERNANTLSGKMARLKVTLSEVGEEIGAKVIPVAEDLADWFLADGLPAIEKFSNEIGDHLGPALDDAAKWFKENKDELKDLGSTILSEAIPPLKTIAGIAADAVTFFAGLPGPVKEFGIQAGVAALVLPRLSAAIGATGDATGSMIGNLRNAETRMAALGRAARGAAGVGGMVLLIQGAQESNETLGALETAAGGAALGFSMGGPWGAAIGTVLGLSKALVDSRNKMNDARESVEALNDAIREGTDERLNKAAERTRAWADSLAGLNAQVTRSTRDLIAEEVQRSDGVANLAAEMDTLGLSQRLVTKAVLGGESAVSQLARAMVEQDRAAGGTELTMRDAKSAITGYKDGVTSASAHVSTFAIGMGDLSKQFRRARHEAREQRSENALLGKALGSLRDKVEKPIITRFKNNAPNTVREIAKIAKHYKLTPNEVRTLIRTSGVDTTRKQVAGVIKQLKEAAERRRGRLEIDAKQARNEGNAVDQLIRSLVNKPHKGKITVDVGAARNDVGRVGKELDEVGRKNPKPKMDLEAGALYTELGRVNSKISALGPYFVHIYEIYHPSNRGGNGGGGGGGNEDPNGRTGRQTTDETSRMLLTLARAGKQQGNKAAKVFHDIGKDVISAFLKGVDGGQKKAEQVFDKIMKAIAEALKKGKIGEKAANEMREAARRMMAEADAMRQQLEAKMQFGKQIASGLRGELDLATLAEGGLSGIIGGTAGLASRLRAFAGQLKELGAAGIPRALIREVAALGSEQGGTVAAALLSGTKAEQRALSKAFRDVNRFADQAGNAASNAVYGSNKDIRREHNVTNVNVRIDAGVAGDPDAIARKLEQIFVKYQRNQGRRLRFQGAA